VKEADWNRCLIAATGASLLENILLERKKLILLTIIVGSLKNRKEIPGIGE